VLNLLPIPILDGGYAVMFTFERLTRRSMSMQARAGGQMVGIVLLGCLMVFAFYNDIMRFFK
jgi:regulator of sigma E protease